MIYDKTYVQSKAQTDSIGLQLWSHQYLQATGLTKYNTKRAQINLVENRFQDWK